MTSLIWMLTLALAVFGVYLAQFQPDILCIGKSNFREQVKPDDNLLLHYFDCRGRAEPIRLMLEDLELKYEDFPYTQEHWHRIRGCGKFAFEQLPALSIGDRNIVQQGAIVRFLARAFDLYGANGTEATQCDVVALGAEDLRQHYMALVYDNTSSEEEFEEKKRQYIQNVIPTWFRHFESIIRNNDGFYGGGHFFVGHKLTFADYMVYDVVDINRALDPHALSDLPFLKGFMRRFESRPNIQKYLSSGRRPSRINDEYARIQ